MPRDPELDSLKSREQDAFRRKQEAYQKYKNARTRTSMAHDVMQSAWKERCSARDAMNREFEHMQRACDHYHAIWDEYGRIRDRNNARIESLRYAADREHASMKDCFERASNAYNYGDKSEAPMYSAEGHEHKARRDELNAEISALVHEIHDARANAERDAPKVDNSAFRRAKEVFHLTKSQHESAQREFKRLKAERDLYKAEFDSAHAEHLSLKEEFRRKLEQVKANKRDAKKKMTDKVNMALIRSNAHYLGTIFGQDAKVVPRNDGTGKTDVYFGGLNAAGDGIGHGHAVIDSEGNVTYLRDAWVSDPKNDYLIDDRADKRGKETHKF